MGPWEETESKVVEAFDIFGCVNARKDGRVSVAIPSSDEAKSLATQLSLWILKPAPEMCGGRKVLTTDDHQPRSRSVDWHA